MKLRKIDRKLRRSPSGKESNPSAAERGNIGSFVFLFQIVDDSAKSFLRKAGLLDDLIGKKLYTFQKLFVGVMT